MTPIQWSSLVAGDIDNDSDIDLVAIGKCGISCYSSKVYINNGTSFVENSTWQSNLTDVHYGSLVLGDIDNDGDLDLALTGCSSGGGYVELCNDGAAESFIYINNGTSFVENSTWQSNLANTWKGSVAFGDIDNDGYLDLITTGQIDLGRISKVYINNGTSFVENSTWQSNLIAAHQSSLALSDIDNDGKLDLILSGKDASNTKFTKVYINNGTSFVENSTWQSNLANICDPSIALGDLDNNGKLDLSLIGCCDIHRIYNNTGNTFEETQKEIIDLIGVFAGSISLGDIDNDGDLDLLTTGRETYTTLYINDGNGIFQGYTQDPEQQIINLMYSSSIFIDIDNDGDLDIILTGWGNDWYQARVYINNITTLNTIPSLPSSNFNSTYSNGKLSLKWGNGSDTETPTAGLYYNLRVGTCSGCHNVVSGVYGGGDDNGYFGNMMQRKSITLDRKFENGQTIYWAVQTIDTGLAKSAWSTEQTYTISTGGTTTTTSSTTSTSSTTTTTQQTTTTTSGSSSPPAPSNGGTPTTTLPATEYKTEKTYSSITPQSPKTITESDLASSRTDLTKIYIDVKEPVTNVQLTIKYATAAPVAIPSGYAYRYMEITKQNLDDSNIEEAKVSFKVNKSWIDDNSIDAGTIALNKLANNTWTELPTTKTNETDTHMQYEATTAGFSYFAITGELIPGATTTTLPTTTTTATTTTTTTLPTSTELPSQTPITRFAIVVIVIAASILAIFYVRKRKTAPFGIERM